MQKIAEVIHKIYQEKFAKDYLMTDEHEECFKKIVNRLSNKDKALLYDLEMHYNVLLIKHEMRAIRYILELMYIEEGWVINKL